jgi:protein TonB
MMVAALTLLLIALGFVLYRDRDFWFPETQPSQTAQTAPAEDQKRSPSPARATAPTFAPATQHRASRKSHTARLQTNASTPPATTQDDSSEPPMTSIARTVLPPLEVEVVAGNVHRPLRPNTNSVQVTLQPGSTEQPAAAAPAAGASADTPASVTNQAAERVQMSVDTADVVSQPVKPGYPLLARQMKVQGSVILQALIGRDGLIQDLQVLSGPPILANAAQEAVKQWHFKPHYQGSEAVETKAKITVNFTISTN